MRVPAVSPRELTGTAALLRGIPPGSRGGIQILGMVLPSSGNADLRMTENPPPEDTAALVPSRLVPRKGGPYKTELAKLLCENSGADVDG